MKNRENDRMKNIEWRFKKQEKERKWMKEREIYRWRIMNEDLRKQ